MSCPFASPNGQKPAEEQQNGTHSNAPAAIDGPGARIPHPPEAWLVGNIREIDSSFAASSFWRLAEIYGPIYSLNLLGRKVIVLSSFEFIDEVCDDSRFEKLISGGLETIRVFVKNGLFTAYGDEEEWGIAHRTLVPAFGPLHIREMFPKMIDIVSQMILRWDRFGPDYEIDVAEDFTIHKYRLAFDVIGLCAFNYRFNAFYNDELPPFAKQMQETLIEVGKRTNRLPLENALRYQSNQQLMDNIHAMWKLCDELVAERKAHPKPEVGDLLNAMLSAKDPVTGKGLSDENIRFQMATFLVAGHETSAGTMDFLIYNLLNHPDSLQKCYEEVDAVIGTEPVQLHHISQLKYLEASLREALRYFGPIPILSRHCKEPTTLGGKYKITPDQTLVCNLNGLHHDPALWGPDANEFRPERFLDGGWERLPGNAWKPFGSGVRACIGRPLAEQEIMIAMAMILQAFVIEQADPDYVLKIKSTLTLKPQNYKIKVRRRPGRNINYGPEGLNVPAKTAPQTTAPAATASSSVPASATHPLAIYYGGNTGTCKAFAEDLQTSSASVGFRAPEGVKSLDSAVERLATDRPVLIVTASYEGLPPDNAKNFVAWLEAQAKKAGNEQLLKDVSYSVFGVGNSSWAATFHRIPKLIDELLVKLGARRLLPPGFVDVSGDLVGPFEDYKANLLPMLGKLSGQSVSDGPKAELQVEILPADAPTKLAGEEVSEALVLKNEELVPKGVGPRKMHMDVLLPPGVEYRSGDYLVITPYNSQQSVLRVVRRFGLHVDDVIRVSGTTKEFLNSYHKGPLTFYELIGTRVELAMPASQRQVTQLASLATAPDEKKTLEALARDDTYGAEVLAKRYSILDLLDDFPSVEMPFAAFLEMLPPLVPRQYSISSSPLATPGVPASFAPYGGDDKTCLTASITYDVHESRALSGHGRIFHGVASQYLSLLSPGFRPRCFVRRTNAPFRLPTDPKTPVIMVAAGTGIAPMRAFIQERAAIARSRPERAAALGPAILYFGCRDYSEDFLYELDLATWEHEGVVKVRAAFSRFAPEGEKIGHVDERIWEDREELRGLFQQGAKILVCGSASRLGRSTQEVCLKIYAEMHPDQTREEAEKWLLKQKEERYVSDVFG